MWEVKCGWVTVARFNSFQDAEFFARKNDPQHTLTISRVKEGT